MTTDTVGDTSGYDSGNNNQLIASKITASASGQIQTLGYNKYGTAGGNVRLALYSHNAGSNKPASLLGETASFAVAAAGWYDQVPTTLPTIVQGTVYWLATQQDNANLWMYFGSSGRRSAATQGFGAFPATWPSGSSEYDNSRIYNMRMTYAPVIVVPTVTTQAATGIGLD